MPCWRTNGRCVNVRKGLVGGIVVLLVVDIIWVGSAGLTRYLYEGESYVKPLFTTYFKTSLFSIYLVAFIFWRPWQRLCGCNWKWRRKSHHHHHHRNHHHHHHQPHTSQGHEDSNGHLPCGDHCEIENGDAKCPLMSEDTSQLFNGTSTNSSQSIEQEPCSHHTVTVAQVESESEKDEQNTTCATEIYTTDNDTVCNDTDKLRTSTNNTECELTNGQGPRGTNHHLFEVPGLDKSVTGTCPIRPVLGVCLLGPPEFEPLGCYEKDAGEEREHCDVPLPPCHSKCCKVRFKPTIEVREMRGAGSVAPHCRRYHSANEVHIKKLPIPLLPVSKVFLLAVIFGVLWFFANYLYGVALEYTSVAAVNTLSSTSSVFIMMLTAIPCLTTSERDKFTLSRLVVTLVSVSGAILVSLSPSGVGDSDSSSSHAKFNTGALYALGGSILYAVYLVVLRRIVVHPDSLEIPMFFGFVGLSDFLLILPLLVIWHITGREEFQLPPTANVWTLLLVNGFIGTVLSELLWLWGVFLTSPLLGTLALSLVTPLSITYSITVGKASFSWLFLFGAVLILISFVGVAILDQYGAWDPLWALIKKAFSFAHIRTQRSFRALSPESQRLLTENHSDTNPDYAVM